MSDLMNIPNITGDDLIEMCNKIKGKNGIRMKSFVLCNWEKILKFNQQIVSKKQVIEHKWHLPEYITKEINEYREKYMIKFPESDIWFYKKEAVRGTYEEEGRYWAFLKISKWFYRYCINNNRDDKGINSRKKALCIFGERGIGKTILCKSLIDDPNVDPNESEFIVYSKNKIVAADFTSKRVNGQLVIFDDIDFMKDNQREMIKNLATGQTCRILSNYHDEDMWEYNCPCIMLTNNYETYSWFKRSPEWQNDLIFIASDVYLGPPGTKPQDRDDIDVYETEGMKQKLANWKQKREEKKNAMFATHKFN